MTLNPKTCVTAEAITTWFLQNYEDPAESCPFDEGEYIYIYGGPRYAREEIEAHCPNASADIIKQAVTYLEQGDVDYDGSGRPGCVAWSRIVEGNNDTDIGSINVICRRHAA
jgi:hypothetical protein